jgi:hypothetical protein
MIIENKRYSILSQGENIPEIMPKKGETIFLSIKDVHMTDENIIETAQVHAQFVEKMGQHAHIIGKATIGEEALACDAKYELGEHPLAAEVGELVVQKIIFEA